MPRTRLNTGYCRVLSSALVTAALALGATAAPAANLPAQMVFFFPGSDCPKGSVPAANAGGRMLLAVSTPGDVGKTYGAALADQEDRRHKHSGTMKVNLPERSISGASSCCNEQATTKGEHAVAIDSGEGTSGLPFIQLLVCQTQ